MPIKQYIIFLIQNPAYQHRTAIYAYPNKVPSKNTMSYVSIVTRFLLLPDGVQTSCLIFGLLHYGYYLSLKFSELAGK